MRYRIRQNFRQNVVLQFNDPMDYASVIPGVRKKEPSKVFGRGLILLNSIFEFQTAYAYKEEKLTDYVKIVCDKLRTICDYKAQRIPILPEVVTSSMIITRSPSFNLEPKRIPVSPWSFTSLRFEQ